jgi:hypothetical protein
MSNAEITITESDLSNTFPCRCIPKPENAVMLRGHGMPERINGVRYWLDYATYTFWKLEQSTYKTIRDPGQ